MSQRQKGGGSAEEVRIIGSAGSGADLQALLFGVLYVLIQYGCYDTLKSQFDTCFDMKIITLICFDTYN